MKHQWACQIENPAEKCSSCRFSYIHRGFRGRTIKDGEMTPRSTPSANCVTWEIHKGDSAVDVMLKIFSTWHCLSQKMQLSESLVYPVCQGCVWFSVYRVHTRQSAWPSPAQTRSLGILRTDMHEMARWAKTRTLALMKKNVQYVEMTEERKFVVESNISL